MNKKPKNSSETASRHTDSELNGSKKSAARFPRRSAYKLNTPASNFSSKIRLLRQKGLLYVSKKAFYRHVFPLIKVILPKKTFSFKGNDLFYCNSKFNETMANERSIEITLGQREVAEEPGSILEIGNVLSNYFTSPFRTVVDKYEVAQNVINNDIEQFTSIIPYNLIISVSTIEHIGFDEENLDPEKIKRVLNHIISNLLADSGRLMVTFPLGWNPDLDNDFLSGTLPFTEVILYKRINWKNHWKIVPIPSSTSFSYGTYIGADYLAVGYYIKESVR